MTPRGSKRTIKGPQQNESGPWWPSKISRSLRLRTDSNFLATLKMMAPPFNVVH